MPPPPGSQNLCLLSVHLHLYLQGLFHSFALYFTTSPIQFRWHCPPWTWTREELALMMGNAAACMKSQQMATTFIRKTQNCPLLHTVFHLLQGKQRLLIRKAALSTISLAGDGVGGKCQPHPQTHSSASLRGAAGLPETQRHSALPHRMLTDPTERSVQASRHHRTGRHCQQTAVPRADAGPRVPPTHSLQPQEAEVWDRKHKCTGGQTGPSISFFFLSLFSSKACN